VIGRLIEGLESYAHEIIGMGYWLILVELQYEDISCVLLLRESYN
jgi:hypothetical protein